ncbi:phage stabilization protein [Caudoviricetes sp.]|nr:phage stabilization protein [Caudoviricetes sp.]UOF79642.1 phage stabilization protein [Caudoviricetes sp.]UOF79835.1 phage stabilization protein [Bacteriophage sp.]UOF81313.1 phage stabilization protein [Caudoviricetes sp.]
MKLQYSFHNNFVAGEVSPRVLARTDLIAHKNGAKRMRNAVPAIQGGFRGRPGTRFVARARYANKVAHLIPFKYSVAQTYVIEAGDLYFRYYTQGARLEEAAKTITNVDNSGGLFRVTTSAAHGYSTGDPVAIRGVLGTPNADGDWTITVTSATQFTLDGSTFAGAYTSGGTSQKIVQTTTTYTEAEIPQLRWAQDGNVLYLVHPSHPVATLARASTTSFTLADAVLDGGPFQTLNSNAALTITSSLTAVQAVRVVTGAVDNGSGLVRITVVAHGHANGEYVEVLAVGGVPNAAGVWAISGVTVDTFDLVGSTFAGTYTSGGTAQRCTTLTAISSYFTSGMVDMLFRYAGTVTDVQGYCHIKKFVSDTVVAAHIRMTLSSGAATDNWALGAFGTVPGYPAEVSFIDQRLVLGRTTVEPQTLWLSKVNDPVDFVVGVTDSHAVTLTLFTEDLNDIQWIVSTGDLLVGTVGGEFVVTGGTDAPITAVNVRARQQTSFGSDPVRPVKLGNSVIYVQRAGHRLRDTKFSFADDGYISNDLSLLADHLIETATVTRLTFQLQPDPRIWAVLSDGAMLTLLVQPDQQVIAFSRHDTSASGAFESVAALPESTAQADRVWTIARRTINSSTVRYIEYFDDTLNTDSALTGTFAPAVTTVNGLSHLNATLVQVLGNGAVYADKTVASGALSAGSGELAFSTIEVGLQFTPTVDVRAPEFVDAQGPMFGRAKRFARVLVYALDTMFLYLNGEVAPGRSADDDMDAAPPTEASIVFQFTQLGATTQPTLTITQPAPLPLYVQSVYGEVEIGG